MAPPTADELRTLLRERLSPKRVLHTLGVESVAVNLTKRWGGDENDARIAALLHDMTKEAPDQLKLLREYGILTVMCEAAVPNVRHAITGAAFAKRLGYDDGIVSAIRWHSTGRAGMTVPEKILYLADWAEPFRADVPGLREIRGCIYTDMDTAMLLGLKATLRYVRDLGQPVDRDTEEAIRWLEGL
ncbi:MAG: bis(5'-nucleosyl)-tetraphosphatase (symmetrical) YqeK [Oscillospiraceae bacterium]|jgi:nicotinate-nucleotide adenylyltransferase|nr:bis(5'-nucleosyl)-tetraphosphatase (symmetrical) YqeK [Oscillospiraceae bacterium]